MADFGSPSLFLGTYPAPRSTFPGSLPVILLPRSLVLRSPERIPSLLKADSDSQMWLDHARRRIEDHDVGPHTTLEHAAIGKAHALCGQRREFTDRIFERESFSSRTYLLKFAECAIGGDADAPVPEFLPAKLRRIIIDGDPGCCTPELHLVATCETATPR